MIGARPWVDRSYIHLWESLDDEPLCARLRNDAVATANRRNLGPLGNFRALRRSIVIRPHEVAGPLHVKLLTESSIKDDEPYSLSAIL